MIKSTFTILLLAILLGTGCTPQTVNESFPVTIEQAKADLNRMKKQPIALQQPVLVLAGFADPGVGSLLLSDKIKKISGSEDVISVSFPVWEDMDRCREIVVQAVEKHFPSDDPEFTAEVDVIGMSMGGIIARYAASKLPDESGMTGKRLRINRLFTIGSPHRGAKMADLPTINSQQADLRKDSDFLKSLNAPGADGSGSGGYTILAYARLEDRTVGACNTAPPNQGVWWVNRPLFETSHAGSMLDDRIVADIARRLRGEQPWTTQPPAALPESEREKSQAKENNSRI